MEVRTSLNPWMILRGFGGREDSAAVSLAQAKERERKERTRHSKNQPKRWFKSSSNVRRRTILPPLAARLLTEEAISGFDVDHLQ
jgi:hypothetical protein